MPKFKPLKYREVVKSLRNLGFTPEPTKATSHETWILEKLGKKYAVTIFFHGSNIEFRDKTLASIIRQSGFSKEEFYKALKK
ncbi:MAG: type II toxin-antitoxin system HicA family toxin [Patescibacteria group bacterium]